MKETLDLVARFTLAPIESNEITCGLVVTNASLVGRPTCGFGPNTKHNPGHGHSQSGKARGHHGMKDDPGAGHIWRSP